MAVMIGRVAPPLLRNGTFCFVTFGVCSIGAIKVQRNNVQSGLDITSKT